MDIILDPNTCSQTFGNYMEKELKEILNNRYRYFGVEGTVNVDPDPYWMLSDFYSVADMFHCACLLVIKHYTIRFNADDLSSIPVPISYVMNESALRIAYRLGRYFQVVYSVHDNMDSPEIHLLVNNINLKTGHFTEYERDYFDSEYYVIQDVVLKVIEKYKVKSTTYPWKVSS